VARTRTTKKLAQRIDLNYFKRPAPRKLAQLSLSLLLPLLAFVWIAWRSVSGDHRVYSSGRLSEPHAVLEKECAVCHVRQAGAFAAEAKDITCLGCHDGPAHHASQTAAPGCATCHVEHRGRIPLTAASSPSCAVCHANLKPLNGAPHYAPDIRSFEDGHPEFAALRPVGGTSARDPGTIKLNHAIHMKPVRRGPNGPIVNLECGNCHRPASVEADLTYADAKYRMAAVSYKDTDEFMAVHADTLKPAKPASGRERMAPVKFANACAACHLLTFDKRFDEGVPHDKPEMVHVFLVRKFTDYITAHPSELQEMQDPERDLTGRPLPQRTRTLTPSQWVSEHTAVAEELLWHKTCTQCHTLTATPLEDTRLARWSATDAKATASTSDAGLASMNVKPPSVAAANTTLAWLPHAKFDHDAHRGFACVSCHPKAPTSTEASDILIPGINRSDSVLVNAFGWQLSHVNPRCAS